MQRANSASSSFIERGHLISYREQSLKEAKVLIYQKEETRDLIDTYMHLTKEALPRLARGDEQNWPVREDHCFQRIVLDTICGGVWYDHLSRPAYKNLTNDQARRAVKLCQEIAEGQADLHKLNQQSLVWRGKIKNPS